jgi:hypothetical protein
MSEPSVSQDDAVAGPLDQLVWSLEVVRHLARATALKLEGEGQHSFEAAQMTRELWTQIEAAMTACERRPIRRPRARCPGCERWFYPLERHEQTEAWLGACYCCLLWAAVSPNGTVLRVEPMEISGRNG